jgi:hypothetical protein
MGKKVIHHKANHWFDAIEETQMKERRWEDVHRVFKL